MSRNEQKEQLQELAALLWASYWSPMQKKVKQLLCASYHTVQKIGRIVLNIFSVGRVSLEGEISLVFPH